MIQSSLSNIPLYTMGVYVLYEGNYQQLDSIRSRFYWQGTQKKRKYHMVRWEALSRPKDFGGLGFTDVRAMRACLLAFLAQAASARQGHPTAGSQNQRPGLTAWTRQQDAGNKQTSPQMFSCCVNGFIN